MNDVSREEKLRQSLQILKENYLPSSENLIFISRCMGDDSWRVRKDAIDICVLFTGDDIIHMLIEGLSSEDNAGLRNASQEALTKIGEIAASHLVGFFSGADKDVRKFIVDIMGDIGAAGFCDFLIGALNDTDENVAIAACENLGKLRCETAVQPLLARLDPKRQWLSFVIIESLAQIGKKFNALPLVPLWDVSQLRKPIIDLLLLFDEPHNFEILTKAFSDSSSYTQENAAKNLFKLLERYPDKLGALKDLLKDTIVFSSHFKKFLNGKTESEKTYALLAFISASPEFFKEFLESGGDEALEFFGTLGQSAPFEKSGLIIDMLDGFDERRQAYLVYLCGMFALDSAIDKLANLCTSSYGHTRQALAFSLGRIGGEKAVACLFGLLDDRYPDVREQAVNSLSKLINSETFPDDVARRVFEEGTAEKIVSIVELMNKVGFFKEEYLLRALRSPLPSVREKAIEIIGNNRLKTFLNEVILFLTDEDHGVMLKAVYAIGEIGGPENVNALAGFLESEDMDFRKAAVSCMYKISPQSLAFYQESIFKNVTPLFFLNILELFKAGAPFQPASLISAAETIDDSGIYAELITAFREMNFTAEAEGLIAALSSKKGVDFLPPNIKNYSSGGR